MVKPLPAAERLHELLVYDAATGVLVWRKTGRTATERNGRYLRLTIKGKHFQAHRVIWKLMTGDDPPEEVNHWNRDGTDNRWTNLRLASSAQNHHYRTSVRRSGLSRGFRRRENGNYQARIQVDGQEICLGTFATAEEADRAHLAEATKSQFLCTDNVPVYQPEPAKPRPKRRIRQRPLPAADWLIVKV